MMHIYAPIRLFLAISSEQKLGNLQLAMLDVKFRLKLNDIQDLHL